MAVDTGARALRRPHGLGWRFIDCRVRLFGLFRRCVRHECQTCSKSRSGGQARHTLGTIYALYFHVSSAAHCTPLFVIVCEAMRDWCFVWYGIRAGPRLSIQWQGKRVGGH